MYSWTSDHSGIHTVVTADCTGIIPERAGIHITRTGIDKVLSELGSENTSDCLSLMQCTFNSVFARSLY